MNKLNVLSAMRLGSTSGSQVHFNEKKIRTVSNLPKIHSLDSGAINNILKSKKKLSNSGLESVPDKHQKSGLDGIEEGKDEEDSEKGNSERGMDESDNENNSSNSESEDSDASSIDLDPEDDEQKLYDKILSD